MSKSAFVRCMAVLLAALLLTQPTMAESVLADPATMLSSGVRTDFVGSNRLSAEPGPAGICLRSQPSRSATGIHAAVRSARSGLSRVTWTWRVDKIHVTADIRVREREDFAAKIAFVFGDPTWWNRDVPTLAYVWTSTPVANGTLIKSTRFNHLRYIQLRGSGDSGAWLTETRNVAADFLNAFGSEAPPLRYIAIFNDNDQTGEPASALFGTISSRD
ncbi:MAG: DUF3047 domain-containing protein [Hyphomicrobiaceae bacterium]|nr:DUF3047 domain-containing protein [Hyphomicrobiaceae bacterium]